MAAARRKLIVVSNRGPRTYERDADGDARRAARRRRPRHGAPRPPRPPRRHLDRQRDDATRIASSQHENSGAAFDETSRDGSPFRLRLVAHEPRAYDWFYNVVSNPTLWFIQHYLWDLDGRAEPGRRRCTTRGTRATRPSTGTSPTRCSRSSSASPSATVFFHDYHLYLAPRHRPGARGRTRRWRTSCTSRGRSRTTGTCSRGRSAGRSTRDARERRRRLPHGALAPQLPALLRGLRRRDVRLRARHRRARRAAGARHREPDLGRRARVRRARGERRRCSRPSGELVRARPGEARSCASIAPIRRRTSSAGSGRSSSTSTSTPRCTGACGMLALLDPSRQDIPEYAEYLGAIQREARARERPLRAGRLDADRPAHRGRLPAVRRGIQAVRRAARERRSSTG